jgi:hypothetical protein
MNRWLWQLVSVSCVLASAAAAQESDGGVSAAIELVAADAGVEVLPLIVDAGAPMAAEPLCAPRQRVLVVESVDGNANAVPAKVLLDDRLVGTSPVRVQLTTCNKRAAVENVETAERRTLDLSDPHAPERFAINWDGRANHWSLSAITDFTFFSPPLTFVPPGDSSAAAVVGAGLRLERWGKYLHGSIGLTANPLLGPLLAVPVLPSVDLFLGANWRPGNDSIRALLSAQLGLSQLIYPSVRGTAGVLFLERLLLTLSLDGRLALPRFILLSFESRIPPVVVGLSAAVGVCL